ncbi:MAG: glutamyl-tRNA reductase [Planctomycetes bacterium]|nr:glutamyl-tRNA reductase [Planctomycetota bacterium]
MNQVQVVGLNHRNTPVDVRERVAVRVDQTRGFLLQLRERPMVDEAILICTCNRVEAWMSGDPETALARAVALIASHGGLTPEVLRPYLYDFRGEQAITHLFSVASSLDSMIVGETQILAQVKDAYRVATEAGSVGKVFHMLFQKAFNVAKMVHTQTKIAEGKLSVASVAVHLAERVFRDLKEKRVLILGAGETGELTAQCLRARGAVRMTIANRTEERAAAVAARLEATPASLESLPSLLCDADIVVACASVEKPLVTSGMLREAMAVRGGKPMFVVDIGVPRNVEDSAQSIPDLYLYNIDHLKGVVERNLAERKSKLDAGRVMVVEEARAWVTLQRGGA